MIQIGEINRLTIKGTRNNTVYLDGGISGDIRLKGKYGPDQYLPGRETDVFIYVDREGCLLATTRLPSVKVGECAYLQVVATSQAGAFLDWGLESDLFVPRSQQQDTMREGSAYVVYVFLSEQNNRITASSKLSKFLDLQPPDFAEGDEVNLLISARTALGYSAVINNSHSGMIYQNEVFQNLTVGQHLTGYIKKIREDLKIDLRLQKTGYQKVDNISLEILKTIKDNGGVVSLTDKSPPEQIYNQFGVSKKVFKKAIGGLYKKKLIIMGTDDIRAVDK